MAARKVLRLPLDGTATLAEAAVMVAEGEAVIENLAPTSNYLYLAENVGGPSRIRRFDLAGDKACELPVPTGSGVVELFGLAGNDTRDCRLYRQTSFTEPGAWWLYDPEAGEAKASSNPQCHGV